MKFLRNRGRGFALGSYALCALTLSCERGKGEVEVQQKSTSSTSPTADVQAPEPAAPVLKCPESSTSRSEMELKEPWGEPGVERVVGQAVPPAPPDSNSTLERKPTAQSVKLFFPFADDRFTDCLAHGWVELKVPACELPLDFAIKSSIGGLKSTAPGHGLTDPMQQSTKGGDIPPLERFYQGLQINNDGIVLLQFSEPALDYLNQAACAADAVRSSLSRTAKQFEGISGVVFVVDGKPFDAWDG